MDSSQDSSKTLQICFLAAVIVIDGVELIMTVLGITTSCSNKNKKAIVERTAKAFKGCARNRLAMEAFKKAWKEAEGNYTQKALAILQYLKDIDPELLQGIIRSLLTGISWYSFMKSIAIFTLTLAAASASAGVAMAIKTGLALYSAVGLLENIQKLCELLS